MNPEVAELVAELPENLRGPATREQELRDLLATLSRKRVPTGRVLRMWCLGSLQARIAVAYTLAWIRRGFAGAGKKERIRNEANLKAAMDLLACMGYMRGAVLKVGQVLGNYPQIVPAEFAELLKSLHFEAPPMHYSLLREQVRRELGADPEELFDRFETEAFAAASLGQVHRARLRTGEDVAVKIQYPNIARTIRADFANLRALLTPLKLVKDWDNLMAQCEELESVLLRETDYRLERENAEKVRACLDGMEGIVIPRMHPEFCTARMLTMDFVPGPHVDAFMASRPSPELRDRIGRRLARVSARLYHSGRMFAADPNPGNFMFLPDGRVGLIDFGCVREITEEEWGVFTLGNEAFRERGEKFRDAIQASAMLTDREMQDEERLELTRSSCEWLWEALDEDEPFDFGDEEYLRRGFTIMGELIRRRYTKSLPVITWMNRSFYGFRALFYLLRARVNLHRIEEEERVRAGD